METLHKKTMSRISVRDAVRIRVLSSGAHARDLANSGSPDSDTPRQYRQRSSQLAVDSPLSNSYSNATPPEIGIPRIIILASRQQFELLVWNGEQEWHRNPCWHREHFVVEDRKKNYITQSETAIPVHGRSP